MTIFPSDEYEVELKNETSMVMNELKRNTKLSNSLVSEWGVKEAFIGRVDNNGFKIISSIVGFGAFCVLTGQFQNKEGFIKIQVHKTFRVLLSILMLFPFIWFGILVFLNGLQTATDLIIPFIFLLLFIRFVLLGLTYKFISKIGLNRLTEIIRITKFHQK